LAQRVCAIRNKEKYCQFFLKHVILSRYFLGYVNSIKTGAAVPHISLTQIGDYTFLIPKRLKEQQKISSILSAYDNLIQNNVERINSLEESAKRLYQEWFVKFRFPGHENVPIIDSELGPIPEGWEVLKLGVLCSIFSGGTPSKAKDEYWNGNVPWLSSGETRNTLIARTENKITDLGVSSSSTKLAKVGDVIIASAGQGKTRGQTSLCMIDTYINQSIIALRNRTNRIHSSGLFCSLNSRYDELRGVSAGSSTRGSLTCKIISELKITVPLKENQILELFDQTLSNIFEQTFLLMENNQDLRNSRDLLLPKLISGQLDVSELDIATEEMVTA
jgi:type I restriction enzyme S subunit